MKGLARHAWGLVCCFALAAQASAQTTLDPQSLLQRVIAAGRSANYTGEFSYQLRGMSGVSRVTRVVDAAGDHERVEFLGGSLREIVRTNDEVHRYLPESRTIIVDRASVGRYPLRLALSAKAIGEVYTVRSGESAQVAGHVAQQVMLEPRDTLRYGHRLWIDSASGLLLKAQMLDEQGQVLEEFAFTDVSIGGAIDRSRLRAGFTPSADWQVVSLRGTDLRPDDAEWDFKGLPPGFRQISLTRRPLRQGEPDALHAVFSDGLVSVSVFIEAANKQRMSVPPSTARSGSTGIFKRSLGDHKVTVLGEVPTATLQRIASGVEARTKP